MGVIQRWAWKVWAKLMDARVKYFLELHSMDQVPSVGIYDLIEDRLVRGGVQYAWGRGCVL